MSIVRTGRVVARGAVVSLGAGSTVSAVVTTVDEATALEAEAEEYPDERGEILVEAAAAWRRAGQVDRARDLLEHLIADGGEDGCFARFTLAEGYFEDGAVDEAYTELARLAREAALTEGPCTFVAELLAARGDLEGALRWYDRAVARLDADDLQALRRSNSFMHVSSVMIRGRREVRRQLGLPVDATDEIVPSTPLQRGVAVVEDLHGYLESGRTPQQVRMLVFQREERAAARRLWSHEYDVPDEEYYPAAERRWRDLANQGVPAIRVVPAIVSQLCEFADRVGGSPTDSEVKAQYAGTVAEQVSIAWPPPRNGPCWCGSGAKYKKCCGRVT
jgi:tetratricopeptide (TPR) repeat protein